MKKILFLIFFPITLFSQTWQYSSGGNTFDGKYKTSSIIGTGSDFPYDKPTLVINKFNDDRVNLYIRGAGYFPSETSSIWAFDNEPGVFYESSYISTNEDSKVIFFNRFKDPTTDLELNKYEIIEKLTKASYVEVRITTNFSKNDLKFSLNGSTKAIDYVLGLANVKAESKRSRDKRYQFILDIKNKKMKEEKEKMKEEKNKLIVENKLNKFREILSLQSISKYDKATIIGFIRDELVKNNYKNLEKYDSLIFEPVVNDTVFSGETKIYYHLDEFPNKLKIQRARLSYNQSFRDRWKVDDDSPLYISAQKIIDENKIKLKVEEEEKKKRIKEQKDRILDILDKLKDENVILFFAKNVILKQRDRTTICYLPNGSTKDCKFFPLSDIKDLKITFKDTKNKFIINADLKIEFEDNTFTSKRNIKLTDNGIMITKDYLKELGINLYQEF